MKIICLNGPPNCGKDTIGAMIQDRTPEDCLHFKFAHPLYKMAKAQLDLNDDNFDIMLKHGKDTELFYDSTVSLRQVMIQLSEGFIKPLLGPTWFAEESAWRVLKSLHAPYCVFTDTGFQAEFSYFEKTIRSQGHEVYLINLYRKGCSFKDDSREWVKDFNRPFITLDNTPDFEQNKDYLWKRIAEFIQ